MTLKLRIVPIILLFLSSCVSNRTKEAFERAESLVNEAPLTGASFYGRPGGLIIIGQIHGHPQSDQPNHVTERTMSDLDINLAQSLQIPVYGVDAMYGA